MNFAVPPDAIKLYSKRDNDSRSDFKPVLSETLNKAINNKLSMNLL